jgi:hypothetical protein
VSFFNYILFNNRRLLMSIDIFFINCLKLLNGKCLFLIDLFLYMNYRGLWRRNWLLYLGIDNYLFLLNWRRWYRLLLLYLFFLDLGRLHILSIFLNNRLNEWFRLLLFGWLWWRRLGLSISSISLGIRQRSRQSQEDQA